MGHFWLILLAALAAGQTPAGSVELGEPVRLDFAGVRMALPKNFDLRNVDDPQMVFLTILVEQDKPVMSLGLTAEAREKGMTLTGFVDLVGMNLNKSLAIGDMKVLKSKRLRIAGTEAEIQVQSYNHRGTEMTALRLFFLRPVSNADIQMAYLLTMEALKPQGRRMLPVLMAVAGTIELFDPVSPVSLKVDETGLPIVSQGFGYSLRPPLWWKAVQRPPGSAVKLFQYDYLRGEPLPEGGLRLEPETASAEECGRRTLQQHVARLKEYKHTYEIVREGRTRMGGQDAYEFVLSHRPPDKAEEEAIIFAERTACANGIRYSLSLYYPGGKKEIVIAALEKLAGEMELFSPQVAATGTAPAAAPVAPPLPSGTAPAPLLPSTAPAALLPSTIPGGAGE